MATLTHRFRPPDYLWEPFTLYLDLSLTCPLYDAHARRYMTRLTDVAIKINMVKNYRIKCSKQLQSIMYTFE